MNDRNGRNCENQQEAPFHHLCRDTIRDATGSCKEAAENCQLNGLTRLTQLNGLTGLTRLTGLTQPSPSVFRGVPHKEFVFLLVCFFLTPIAGCILRTIVADSLLLCLVWISRKSGQTQTTLTTKLQRASQQLHIDFSSKP